MSSAVRRAVGSAVVHKSVVHVTPERCVNCHQCIAVCPSKFCNNGAGDYIQVDPDLCIGCGACIAACTHGARSGVDDFDAFMQAMAKKENIVAIVAPAVAANFPGLYLHLNGWLKNIGVKAVFDVSFGAELTVKSYLEAIKTKKLKHVIAQPCPALVGYIELHKPELLPYLAPADSPMMHTMRMVREFYNGFRSAEFVVLSPCYAKRREFDEVGIGKYNVTFKSLDLHFRANQISLSQFTPTDYDNPPAERAVLFSTPGGLLRTAQREVPGIEASARKIEGLHTIYHYLDHFEESVKKECAPLLVDCLNCEAGCNGGPGTLNGGKPLDIIENSVEKRSNSAQKEYAGKFGWWGRKKALHNLHKHINAHWRPGLYDRKYVDVSALVSQKIRMPSPSELDAINRTMNKLSQSDFLDCCSCGYNSCKQMGIAIFNGLNKPENCRHYALKIIKNQEEATSAALVKRKEISRKIQNLLADAVTNLQSIATASEELNATIREVAGNSDKAHQSSVEVGGRADSISVLMRQLGEAANDIGNVTKSITDISSQTNLLALNATIEAASAKEAGKGFAVVATEVKNLAKKAASASENIKAKIYNVQTSVGTAITDIDSITRLIKHSEEIILAIATAITEQAAVSQEVSSNISRILAAIQDGNAQITSME